VRGLLRVADGVGVRRIVLLSGRGEEIAQRAEDVVRAWDGESTIVRASWFTQNFTEGPFAPSVAAGLLELPVGDVVEPFVDVDDIAEIAASALLDDRHVGRTYEVTGPEALTFAEAVRRIGVATGRPVAFTTITSAEFAARLAADGTPPEVVELMGYLFEEVLDGRNIATADGVREALGRPARSFDTSIATALAEPDTVPV